MDRAYNEFAKAAQRKGRNSSKNSFGVNSMNSYEQWIWVPETLYPDRRKSAFNDMSEKKADPYAVAEFKREYRFDADVQALRVKVSGDASFQLYLNGDCVMTGPATIGGDFLGNDDQPTQYYAYEAVLPVSGKQLNFSARVQKDPVLICEYSKGHGGFMLKGEAILADGTRHPVQTGIDWLCRINGGYTNPRTYDGGIGTDAFVPSEVIPDIWRAQTAPIPHREEHTVSFAPIRLAPGEKRSMRLEMDRIYAGFLQGSADQDAYVHVQFRELEENGSEETLLLTGKDIYRGFYMHSAGVMDVVAENRSGEECTLQLSFVCTHYPVTDETPVLTSDTEINQVLDTCRHTLKYCRQTHHLDSPRHCEPLACTGDYHIESLMTLFSFGDMRLAAFDVMRTARMLERHDGRMFHTTYSLIWVRMLQDVFMMTGDHALLCDCRQALDLLLRRFETYMGANGLIETPPDYMFVDWIYIDGLSMHHPPKALGQSCLNMYYFAALDAAARIYDHLQLHESAAACRAKRDKLQKAILTHLFDAEKNMFFEGLNTPTDPQALYMFLPANVDKRYYLKHANILAACFGVCDDETAASLIHRIMAEEIEGDIQPYFTHYLLEAVSRLQLCEQYTLPIIRRWVEPVKNCPKGLVEGFVKPEPTYSFDHSHAWGGTPLYSLPKALLGLEILSPGMKDIAVHPTLLGLGHASLTLHTPQGPVHFTLEQGKDIAVSCPAGVNVHM